MTDLIADRHASQADFVGASPAAKPYGAAHFAQTVLSASAALWFIVAVSGQLLFALYVVVFYGGSAMRGDYAAWNAVLPKGHIVGDTVGNLILGIHLLIAAIVTIAGPLQLLPSFRARFPVFHRWNGRVYVATVIIASVTGLFAVWTRGQAGGIWQHVAISINAVLIIVAAVTATVHAVGRRIARHRRWALRLFMLVSGVWFFRVGLMFWIAVNRGPAGFDPQTFQGPALVALAFMQFMLPLALLELYFLARQSTRRFATLAIAGVLLAATACMAVGIVVAAMGMWLPRIG